MPCSSSKKDGSPKTWRPEQPEAVRKESVIKSIVRETSEKGKTSNEQRPNRDSRTSHIDQRSGKLDYQRKDDREGVVPGSTGKFPVGRSEERSPPILSRSHDVTPRPQETSHPSFVSSAPIGGKTVDNPLYTNGTPGYSYMSPRKAYDPMSSHRRDTRVHEGVFLNTPKDDSRVVMDKGRINGVKDSPGKVRDIEETKPRNFNKREDSSNFKYLKRSHMCYDERDEKPLRYSEDLMNRGARRDEALKRRREENERQRSSPSLVHELPERMKSNFPVTTAHSVETIMNGRSNTSPAKPSERSKEDTRARNEWTARLSERVPERVAERVPERVRERAPERASERVPEIVDSKKMEVASRDDVSRDQRVVARTQQSREDHESRRQRELEERSRDQNFMPRDREQRSRDQITEKDDMKIAEIERLRYVAAVNEQLRAGRPSFDPRLMNPGMVDHRGVDSRLYATNGNPRGFEPRKYDSRRRESVDIKSMRNLDEQSDEKLRSEERISRRNETSNDRTLPEHVRALHNDDGRPRSAPHCGTRSMSPNVNGTDVKQNRTDIKSRGLDSAGRTETTETKRNDSGNIIGQPMPSKTRSPLNEDDVAVSKGNASSEPSRSSSVSRPGSETSVSSAMRTGLGNLGMTPVGAGYPNLPMLNPYLQLLAQNEGSLPMLLPMANGMYPHDMPDPSHAPMNEHMMKLWREFIQIQGEYRVQ